MKNVTYKVAGNLLTIEVDLSKSFGPSSSGKTEIVATTEGNQPIEGHPDVKLGVNIFKALPKKA